jgi:hypothetical protein
MEKPFPALKHLDLECDSTKPRMMAAHHIRGLPIPGTFLGGASPGLQHLRLKRISFPYLRTFLLSAHDLVTVELKSIFQNDYISMEAIVRPLAALTRLKTLSITFYNARSPPDQNESRPEFPMRAILPALTRFHYRGYSKYLEDFFAQINAPRLDNLSVEYFPHEIKALQLSQFIDRTASLKLNQFGTQK